MRGLKMVVFPLIFVVLVSGATQAQDRSAEADKLYERLEADFRADMEKAMAAERAKVEAWQAAAKKAEAEGKPPPPMPAMRMAPPDDLMARYLGLYEKAAAQFAGTDEAIRFLQMFIMLGGITKEKERVAAACTTLTTTHIKSAQLAEALQAIAMASMVIGEEESAKFLRAVEAGSPHSDIRARAILTRATDKLENAPVKSADYAMAKKEALRAAEIAEGTAIKREVRMLIDAREKIVSQKVAPDIVGVDLDGVAFKLSDYKGKIIMLDFWGNW
jgi:hypothetical protein